ncbi:MAG: hypothetical protein U9N45_00935, partial [Gemmatimonadota bacterium]|nr:hypothetical protein [Gemmatimonadota bacterium]
MKILHKSRELVPLVRLDVLSCVVITHLTALVLPGVWFLPVLNGAVFFYFFYQPLKEGNYRAAVIVSLIWALYTTLLQVALTVGFPELMAEKIWNGVAYRDEMMIWVRTGEGPEGDVRLFLPIHLKHFAVFTVAGLLTGGFLGLLMGAALLGYMNFYAGCLIAEAHF